MQFLVYCTFLKLLCSTGFSSEFLCERSEVFVYQIAQFGYLKAGAGVVCLQIKTEGIILSLSLGFL